MGVLLILAALVSYGLAINLARPLQQRNGALPVIWRAQAAALVLTAPLGIRDLLHAGWATGPWLSLLALGALGTGLAFVLATNAAGRVGSTRAASTAFLIHRWRWCSASWCGMSMWPRFQYSEPRYASQVHGS